MFARDASVDAFTRWLSIKTLRIRRARRSCLLTRLFLDVYVFSYLMRLFEIVSLNLSRRNYLIKKNQTSNE